jgi:hypothetical protein
MIEIFDKFLVIMFGTSFWHFCGSLIFLFIVASVIESLVEHTFSFIQTIIRGHPQITNNYYKETEKKDE